MSCTAAPWQTDVHGMESVVCNSNGALHTYLLNCQSCPHWSVRSALLLIHNGCSRPCLWLASSRARPAPKPTAPACEPCHFLGNEARSPQTLKPGLLEPDHSVCRMLTLNRPAGVAYIHNGDRSSQLAVSNVTKVRVFDVLDGSSLVRDAVLSSTRCPCSLLHRC